jgi:hypothetical protein
MIIVFNCPHCAAILRMKEQYGGQRGRCPQCQGAITVPAIETDAGMDLMPLDPAASASTAPTVAPAAESAPLLSIESRLRSLAGASATDPMVGAAAPSDTGDSNIGLAPVDDSPAARAAPPARSALDPPPRAAKESGPSDSTIGLAPVDDGPTPSVKTPPPPPPPPSKSAANEEEDDNFALAPLEEVAHKPAPRAPSPAPAPASAAAATNGSAVATSATPGVTTDSNADLRISFLCDGCGARMRVPPTAAGRQLTCPRCKKKLRVPETAPSAASASASTRDTRATQDTSSSSSNDLDIGMLGDLGAAGPAAAGEEAPAALRPPGPKGKGKAKAAAIGHSQRNTLLGMSPLVVYGVFGTGLTALITGLAIVYVMTKPAPVPTPAPAVVAQNPVPGGAAPQPPTPGAPPATAPGAAPMPTAPTPATSGAPMPMPGAPSTGAPMPAAPMPGVATPGGAPASAVPAPAAPPAPPRVEWRNRIPVVRLTTGRFKSEKPPSFEEGEIPVELLAVPPIEPRVKPSDAEVKALVQIFPHILKTQQPILTQLKGMTDLASIKESAPQWADLTAMGLDQIRQTLRLNGVGLSQKDNEMSFDAMMNEESAVMQAQAELERLALIPGAIDALEAALKERAARDPNSALAATLKQAPPH